MRLFLGASDHLTDSVSVSLRKFLKRLMIFTLSVQPAGLFQAKSKVFNIDILEENRDFLFRLM